MSVPEALDQIAARQLSDYDSHHPGLLFGEEQAMTIPEAYLVQFRVAALRHARGEPAAGFKIGCIGETVKSQLGLDSAVFGHVFETEIHSAGCVLDLSHFDRLAIEGEFAVRLACDIPRASWLDAHGEEAIATFFPVIELHNYVFRGSSGRAAELIANNALHAGTVLPWVEERLRQPADLMDESISVWLNGEKRGSSQSGAIPGGPLASVRAIATHLEQFGFRLQRGQVVLTGSPLPLYPINRGDHVEVRCGRLPSVSVSCP